MSRIALAVLVVPLLCAGKAWAEQETLLKSGIESGFFGAPVVKFSEVKKEFAVFAGLRGGWIINHDFSLGLGGYGLANDIHLEDVVIPYQRDIEFGYGGVELEYINSSARLVHFTVYTLVGAGGITLPFLRPDQAEAVFVLEPQANLVLNIATAMRLGAGVGYRWVSGTNSVYYSNEDMSAFSVNLTLLFGRF